jgi:hypothetical protein
MTCPRQGMLQLLAAQRAGCCCAGAAAPAPAAPSPASACCPGWQRPPAGSFSRICTCARWPEPRCSGGRCLWCVVVYHRTPPASPPPPRQRTETLHTHLYPARPNTMDRLRLPSAEASTRAILAMGDMSGEPGSSGSAAPAPGGSSMMPSLEAHGAGCSVSAAVQAVRRAAGPRGAPGGRRTAPRPLCTPAAGARQHCPVAPPRPAAPPGAPGGAPQRSGSTAPR